VGGEKRGKKSPTLEERRTEEEVARQIILSLHKKKKRRGKISKKKLSTGGEVTPSWETRNGERNPGRVGNARPLGNSG